MIFELIAENMHHNPLLRFNGTDQAWEAFNVITDAFPYPLCPRVVCVGGYENAIELFQDDRHSLETL